MALQPKKRSPRKILNEAEPRFDDTGHRRRPTRRELTEEQNDALKQVISNQRKARRNRTAEIPDRYVALVNGTLKIEDLDDEEIFRGQLRNKSGDFRGRPPKFVPQQFVRALREEQARRFQAEMHGLMPEAMKAIERVLIKKHPQPGDGAIVQAAFKTIERFAGRVPETVDLKVSGEVSVLEQNVADVIEVVYDAEEIEP